MSALTPSPGLAARLRLVFRSPVVLGGLFLWLVLIACEVVTPFFFLHDDNADQFMGFFVHDFRVLTETGRLAEINYYQYGGEPFLEQGQSGVLYPPAYLGVALAKFITGDVLWTIEWVAALHLTVAFLGFYAWMRQVEVDRWPAVLGALAWVLNPFVIIIASSWITIAMVACYLPWLFWALDRLFLRPGWRASLGVGGVLGFFFLQGMVQWVVYAVFFLAIYAACRFSLPTAAPRLRILYYLMVATLVFFVLALPLLLPMLHAMDASVARGHPLPLVQALTFPVTRSDLWRAQFFAFRPHMVFGTSSVILYAPAFLLFPLMVLWFPLTDDRWGRRLFPLLLLFPLALFFSSRWHLILTLQPFFDRFRWPFKVFIFAEFFLLAGGVISLASYAQTRRTAVVRAKVIVCGLLGLMLGSELIATLAHHQGNYFSNTTLPTLENPLPEADPRLGRVLFIGQIPYDTTAYRDLTYLYGTLYGVPVLGGYNPLMGHDQSAFGLGLAFTDLFSDPITPELREKLNARAVRYWIIDPAFPQRAQVEALPGLKLLRSDPDRIIYENTLAWPMAFSMDAPGHAYAISYAGNSLLVPLEQRTSRLAVSLEPTDGWWYRLDHGSWRVLLYQDDHLRLDIPAAARQVEISYFDPRFHRGLWGSLILVILLGILWGMEKCGRGR